MRNYKPMEDVHMLDRVCYAGMVYEVVGIQSMRPNQKKFTLSNPIRGKSKTVTFYHGDTVEMADGRPF